MRLVVADTGPLLHLHQIGAVELLGHLGAIHVTPTVRRELRRHAPGFFRKEAPGWLVPSEPDELTRSRGTRWVSAGVLDPGEAEALAFAQEMKADYFITDDAAARTLGESLGLQVRGTLGILLHAAATGHLDRFGALQKLAALEHRSTLWMSARVKRAAHAGLARIFG